MLITVAFMIVGCQKDTPSEPTPVPLEPEPETPIDEQTIEELADSGENIMVITSGKVIEPREIEIKQGETIIIKNDDNSPHIMRVSEDSLEIARSKRLMPGDVYEYAFTKQGTFGIRDIFSGSVNAEVIVK